MKRDGRTLDHATLEEIRLLALRRVKDGEKPSAGHIKFFSCKRWSGTASICWRGGGFDLELFEEGGVHDFQWDHVRNINLPIFKMSIICICAPGQQT